jgi:hypothetical protein
MLLEVLGILLSTKFDNLYFMGNDPDTVTEAQILPCIAINEHRDCKSVPGVIFKLSIRCIFQNQCTQFISPTQRTVLITYKY